MVNSQQTRKEKIEQTQKTAQPTQRTVRQPVITRQTMTGANSAKTSVKRETSLNGTADAQAEPEGGKIDLLSTPFGLVGIGKTIFTNWALGVAGSVLVVIALIGFIWPHRKEIEKVIGDTAKTAVVAAA